MKYKSKLFIKAVYIKGKIVNNTNAVEKTFSHKLNDL